MHRPTKPLHTIMMTANTVSRASAGELPGVSTIDSINATSMIVTASVRTSVPNGSPTRCAITSAW
jgi:hypothetical protein